VFIWIIIFTSLAIDVSTGMMTTESVFIANHQAASPDRSLNGTHNAK
jgi:hypothetical protein